MRSLFVLLIAFAALFATAQAGSYRCNATTVNVPWDQYTGVWYEIATSPVARATFEKDCDCVKANYSPIDSTMIRVENTCVNSQTGKPNKALGTALIVGPGQLGVSFSIWSPRAPYNIIQYSAGNYAVVWSCTEIFGINLGVNMWVLSRTPTMDPNIYNSLIRTAQQQTGFDVSTLTLTRQSNCPAN